MVLYVVNDSMVVCVDSSSMQRLIRWCKLGYVPKY